MKLIISMIILFVIFSIFAGIGIYSLQTAKTFCGDMELEYYGLDQNNRELFDLKDDVICYQMENNEIIFFYFKR